MTCAALFAVSASVQWDADAVAGSRTRVSSSCKMEDVNVALHLIHSVCAALELIVSVAEDCKSGSVLSPLLNIEHNGNFSLCYVHRTLCGIVYYYFCKTHYIWVICLQFDAYPCT